MLNFFLYYNLLTQHIDKLPVNMVYWCTDMELGGSLSPPPYENDPPLTVASLSSCLFRFLPPGGIGVFRPFSLYDAFAVLLR